MTTLYEGIAKLGKNRSSVLKFWETIDIKNNAQINFFLFHFMGEAANLLNYPGISIFQPLKV